MRLTVKGTKIKLSDTERYDLQDHKMFTKLSQLEDIEEELGIDLVTLHKALYDGFYFISRECGKIWDTRLYLKPLFCAYNKTIEIQQYVDNAGGYWYKNTNEFVRLKDYGKTWALTKEELE